MKKIVLIIFIMTSCTNNQSNKINVTNIKFSKDLSLEEFKIRLEEYSNNSPYPNIDN